MKMNIFFFLISNVSNVMILKYYFNWNYSLSDIRYRLKKKKNLTHFSRKSDDSRPC